MVGWIKLHRQILNWEWYSDTNAKVLFIHCLVSANYEEKDWRGITIKPGQFFTSLGNLSLQLGLSIKQIRTALDKLSRTNDITTQRQSNGILVTVVKYRAWQVDEEKKGRLRADVRADLGHVKGQQLKKERNKEVKNIEDRKKDFSNSLKPFVKEYGETMVKAFYEYWAESNPGANKFRKEMNKTFDINLRLKKWHQNELNFNGDSKEQTNQRANKFIN